MKKGLILSLICLMVLTGCGKEPTIKNGDNAIITFEKGKVKHQISADELFEELKSNYGLEATLKMIDSYILETEFKDYLDTAKDLAKSNIEGMIESYGSKEQLLNDIIQRTNFNSIEAYQNYMFLVFLQSHATEEYAKKQVTEKEIKDYYKNDIKGDIEIYHILITPDVTDKMTKEEKDKADTNAKNKIKELVTKLNNAKDKFSEFKKLAKENSNDKATAKKDGNLGFMNYDTNNSYRNLLDTAYKLKDGEYSKKEVKTEYGYHLIYRNASKPKKELKEIKDDIITKIANKNLQKDPSLTIEGIKYYRKLYNLDIKDSTLNRQYGIYLNNLANRANQ